jgi:hypothetical protein
MRGETAFDPHGNLWIATDGKALGSNGGLFAVPVKSSGRGHVKQFLAAPRGAETCGPIIIKDRVLVAAQHPGEISGTTAENAASHWPDGPGSIPRPSVVTVGPIEVMETRLPGSQSAARAGAEHPTLIPWAISLSFPGPVRPLPADSLAPSLGSPCGRARPGEGLVKRNIDENPASAAGYGVMSIPTTNVHVGGEVVVPPVALRHLSGSAPWALRAHRGPLPDGTQVPLKAANRFSPASDSTCHGTSQARRASVSRTRCS